MCFEAFWEDNLRLNESTGYRIPSSQMQRSGSRGPVRGMFLRLNVKCWILTLTASIFFKHWLLIDWTINNLYYPLLVCWHNRNKINNSVHCLDKWTFCTFSRFIHQRSQNKPYLNFCLSVTLVKKFLCLWKYKCTQLLQNLEMI